LGGLIDIGRPQQLPVGAFAVSSAYLQRVQGGSAISDLVQDAGEPPRFLLSSETISASAWLNRPKLYRVLNL
jgi:hypothetical protein